MWDWNLVTDQMWWNDSMMTLFGYAPADLESDSRSWSTHIHPDDKDAILADIHRALDSDKSDWEAEYRSAEERHVCLRHGPGLHHPQSRR